MEWEWRGVEEGRIEELDGRGEEVVGRGGERKGGSCFNSFSLSILQMMREEMVQRIKNEFKSGLKIFALAYGTHSRL